MKKFILSFVAVALLFSIGTANAELKKSKPNPPQAIARGFSNLMFGWLEVPRGLIYENSRVPVVGFVTGASKGSLLTTWRVIAGTVDIVGMGLTREGLYADNLLPEYVWDAPWIAPCGEDIVEPVSIRTNPCQGLCKEVCPRQKKCKKMKGCQKMKECKGKKKCGNVCPIQKKWNCK